jgi:transglycosylase-like protein with SLT domain
MSRGRVPLTLVLLSACAQLAYTPCVLAGPHDELILKHASAHGVPESLVRRVIHIESRGNARVVSKGNYGLMQIRLGTARAMGYRGTEQGLLDADTNMTYAVKYLAGAYRAAGCNEGRAISYYQRGYHGAGQSKCAAPPAPATQIAERPEEKILAERRSVRAERATVAARPPSDRAAPQSGDVLRPRLVQTQTISKPKQEPIPQLAAAKSQPAPVSAAKATATPPVPVVTQAALAPMPGRPAKTLSEPPATEAVPMPRARPVVDTPSLQAVAALSTEAAASPREMQAKPAHGRTDKRARSSRKVREEPGLLAALKRLITPARTSRMQIRR